MTDATGASEKVVAMAQAARTRGDARAARIEKARQRRLEVNKDREAMEARVDAAVADVYQAQEERDAAAALIEQADLAVGLAIARVLAEGVAIAQVADLTGLSVNQVQRLKSAAASDPADASVAASRGGGAALRDGSPDETQGAPQTLAVAAS